MMGHLILNILILNIDQTISEAGPGKIHIAQEGSKSKCISKKSFFFICYIWIILEQHSLPSCNSQSGWIRMWSQYWQQAHSKQNKDTTNIKVKF